MSGKLNPLDLIVGILLVLCSGMGVVSSVMWVSRTHRVHAMRSFVDTPEWMQLRSDTDWLLCRERTQHVGPYTDQLRSEQCSTPYPPRLIFANYNDHLPPEPGDVLIDNDEPGGRDFKRTQ